ncbi:MAG: endonuclease/exonuclease/phosphatase family protein [Nocardioidaceae bacterium]
MTRVRVMTYNILMGGRRGQPLYDVVREVAPDVLLVNESPKGFFTWRRDCRHLMDEWTLRMVTGGRPAGSNLIATVESVGVKQAGSETLRQPLFQPRRGIAWAQLRVRGSLLGVVSCHLSLDRERREQEVRRVIEVADRLRGTVVVAGDLNEPPTGPCWQALRRAGYVDHGDPAWKTFPSDDPTKRIDALLVCGAAEVVHVGDPGLPEGLLAAASDHRPVLAEIAL